MTLISDSDFKPVTPAPLCGHGSRVARRAMPMLPPDTEEKLKLRAKAMTESLAGFGLRQTGATGWADAVAHVMVIHRIGSERPSNSESNPSGRTVSGKAT